MFKVKAKKWGSSVGVIIPTSVARKYKIRPREDLIIEIKGKNSTILKELFGSIAFSKPAPDLVREARKELESKFA